MSWKLPLAHSFRASLIKVSRSKMVRTNKAKLYKTMHIFCIPLSSSHLSLRCRLLNICLSRQNPGFLRISMDFYLDGSKLAKLPGRRFLTSKQRPGQTRQRVHFQAWQDAQQQCLVHSWSQNRLGRKTFFFFYKLKVKLYNTIHCFC